MVEADCGRQPVQRAVSAVHVLGSGAQKHAYLKEEEERDTGHAIQLRRLGLLLRFYLRNQEGDNTHANH